MNMKKKKNKVNLIIIEMSMEKKDEKLMNKIASEIPISKNIQQLNLDDFLFLPPPNSFYPTARKLLDSNYPKSEIDFVFTENMNDELVIRFNIKNIGFKNTEDSTAISGYLNIIFYARIVVVKHVPVKKSVDKQEVNWLRKKLLLILCYQMISEKM